MKPVRRVGKGRLIRHQEPGDDPHRLLGVVGPVRPGKGGRRRELGPSEPAIDRSVVCAMERPGNPDHQEPADRHPDQRGKDDERKGLHPRGPRHDRPNADPRDRGPGVAPDERVRRRRRDPEVPRQDVPHDRPEEASENDVRVDDRNVDQPLPHRLRDGGAKGERRDEVEEGRPEDRLERGKDARGYHRGDRVRRVVHPVDEVEDERDRDDEEDVSHRRRCVWPGSSRLETRPSKSASGRRSRARAQRFRSDRCTPPCSRKCPST